MSMPDPSLKPRKLPVQARSTATVDALHTATIQVLTREGLLRCTTSRVAMRAGISVGSLYQYYPNRDALLAAVLEKHLNEVLAVVEQTCRAHHGKSVAEFIPALVSDFLNVKLRNPLESRALYAIAGERGGARLVTRIQNAIATALTDTLTSAPDVRAGDARIIALMMLTALAGPVRVVLEGSSPPGFEENLEIELVRLLSAYVQAGSITSK
jgi:AcrR family transcriptional regulator